MAKIRSKITYTSILCLAIMLLSIFAPFGVSMYALADTTTYSNVLDDLRLDPNFDVGYYPSNSKDYSISVIQIAESTDGDLLIYVYQPCQRSQVLTATKINMSLSQSVDGTKLYDLALLSSEGVFCKYKVKDLTVSEKTTRYYNISSIYRKWISSIDDPAGHENTVNGVAYKVGQCWSARSTSDSVIYDMSEEEVLTVTDQMVGLRRYYTGFTWNSNASMDAHYITFNCDHAIDKLLSATVDFYTQDWKHTTGQAYEYGEKVRHTVNLYDYQMASTGASGWFAEEAYWHRMNSTAEFVKEVDVTGDDKETLLKYDWVLNFYETTIECAADGSSIVKSLLIPFYVFKAIYDGCTTSGTYVSNVTLLRLEFEHSGEIYNLGVVANTQTGSGLPTNSKEKFDLLKWLEEKTGVPKGVWIALIVLIVLSILMPILSVIFPAFGELLKACLKGLMTFLLWIVKAIAWLICLPFKGIKLLVEKIKDGKG